MCIFQVAGRAISEGQQNLGNFLRVPVIWELIWSTTTINESYSLEGGKSVTRSTESYLKGRGKDDGMGANGGGKWDGDLPCFVGIWHNLR